MKDIQIPNATYRIQFTPQFGFCDALKILPYLEKLGISHIYASPITRARTGSMHGYDVCDHSAVNPELGSREELFELLDAVKQRKMGWVQDIVPNHMAYSHENPYLLDVLENGPSSRYKDFFDITWEHQHESLRGRILAPFLGKPYGQCVVDGELGIVSDHDGLWTAYYDQRYPLSPESYWSVFGEEQDGLPDIPADSKFQEFSDILAEIKNGTAQTTPEIWKEKKKTLSAIIRSNSTVASYVQQRVAGFSTGTPPGNARFDYLMSQQHFRLAFWKIAAEELNYRRFFTVSDLICVRVESAHVFDETHRFILDLIDRGLVTGLRIDHIDGLFDPAAYLQRLRKRAPHVYLLVEKILEKSETLAPDWPVQGTTGYDFLCHMNYAFCNTKSAARFDRIYERFTGNHTEYHDLEIQKKRLIIGKHMAGDIDNLAHLIIRIAGTDLMGRDITLYGLRRALVEVLANFPVYRTYITSGTFSDDDAHYISLSMERSRETLPGFSIEFDFIERFLMMHGDTVLQNDYDEDWKSAVMRFQQFTGPLMAKGFEDTLFYVYNRHVALNEVGGWPVHFGISAKEFHAFIRNRLTTHPYSMNASATHDTKRGEDTRARLQVLTEMPDEWAQHVKLWHALNSRFATKHKNTWWPDRNDEFLLYQTLAGTFPRQGELNEEYISRIREYMIKAVREAKVHTAWIKPDERYEQAVTGFIESILDVSGNPVFVDSLRTFSRTLAWFGMVNSLSQIILKTTLPGVPDFYQGTELWDFSLVDPDNRRPVDYTRRISMMEHPGTLEQILCSPEDGQLKALVIHRCLKARKDFKNIFLDGRYIPLSTMGTHRHNVLAFARISDRGAALIIVPRFVSQLAAMGEYPRGSAHWSDTGVRLPAVLTGHTMKNILTGTELRMDKDLFMGNALDSFPAAVFVTSSAPEPSEETR